MISTDVHRIEAIKENIRLYPGTNGSFLFQLLIVTLMIFSCESSPITGMQNSDETQSGLNLIAGAENATIHVNKGTDSYYIVDVEDVAPNGYIRPGNAKAWCISWNNPITTQNAVHKEMKLYSTFGDNRYKKINYLLNIQTELMAGDESITFREIQAAIWTLLNDPEFDPGRISASRLPPDMVSDGIFNFDRRRVSRIVNLVNRKAGFFDHTSTSAYALIAETPNGSPKLIIQVDASVWAYGQYSFRELQIRDTLGLPVEGNGQWGWIYEYDPGSGDASTELVAGGWNDDGIKSPAGAGAVAGSLDIRNYGNHLEVTFNAFSEYKLSENRLWVGCSLMEFPVAGPDGFVATEDFPYVFDGDAEQSHSFSVDISAMDCSSNLFIAAFAGSILMATNTGSPPDDFDPVIEMIDLSEYGLANAMDINDRGHIIGGGAYWNSETGVLTQMPVEGRALNNHGKVVDRKYIWDADNGVTEITYCCVGENDHVNISAYDINDSDQVTGELEFEFFDFEDEETGPVYSYEWFGFIWEHGEPAKDNALHNSTAWSINDAGNVVGTYVEGGFIWQTNSGQAAEPIPVPQGNFIDAYAINNHNQVAGQADVQMPVSITAVSPGPGRNRQQQQMNRMMRLSGTFGLYAYGHVAEMVSNSTFDAEAFPWRRNGMKTDNADKSYSSNTDMATFMSQYAYLVPENGINNTIRRDAFIWDEQNGVEVLGNLGGEWSIAWDINDYGQVVGYGDIGEGRHRAFYWDRMNGMIELPTYGGNSYARAINNHGQIVGYSYDEEGDLIPVQWTVRFNE
jgi:probable HAF family extracellular repeat protein